MSVITLLLIGLAATLYHKSGRAYEQFTDVEEARITPFVRGQSPDEETESPPPSKKVPPPEKPGRPADWTVSQRDDSFRAPEVREASKPVPRQGPETGNPWALQVRGPHPEGDDSVPRSLFASESPHSARSPESAGKESADLPTLPADDESLLRISAGTATAGTATPGTATAGTATADGDPFAGRLLRDSGARSEEGFPAPPPKRLESEREPADASLTAWPNDGIRTVSGSVEEPQPTLAREPEPFDLKPTPLPTRGSPAVPNARPSELTMPIAIPEEVPAPRQQERLQGEESPPKLPFGSTDPEFGTVVREPKEAGREEPVPLPLDRDEPRAAKSPPRFDADSGDSGKDEGPQTARTASAKQPETPPEQIHEVQSGDNYWTISRQHYGAARYFAALAEYNKHRIPRPERMKPGMIVLIPDPRVLHERYPKLAGTAPEGEERDPTDSEKFGFFVDQEGQPLYRVNKGDTLTDVAQKHLGRSSRWVQIYGMNRERIPDPATLKIGTLLRLPRDASQVVLAPEETVVR